VFDCDPVGDGLFPPGAANAEDDTSVGSEADLLDQVSQFLRGQPVREKAVGDAGSRAILLPYSGSESAELALETAIQLFSGSACEIRVVHFREWIASRAGPSFLFTQSQAGRLAADAALRLRRSGFAASAVVRDSNRSMVPVRIIGEAAVVRADAIVLGARRRRAFTAAVMGSVSRRVVRQSPCPVVLAHPPDARQRAGAKPGARSALMSTRGRHGPSAP
jgi:nucleotide-binding universal stress UspA family protein